MILLAAIVLSLTIGLVRGGRLRRIAEIPLRYGWLALIALGLQVAFVSGPRWGLELPVGVLVGSYALLVGVIALNWRLPGMPLMALGLALNLAVMAANGGYMPVTPEALARAGLGQWAARETFGSPILGAKDILLPREGTRLWWLSDILVVPGPAPFRAILSVGDILLAAGVAFLLQKVLVPAKPSDRA